MYIIFLILSHENIFRVRLGQKKPSSICDRQNCFLNFTRYIQFSQNNNWRLWKNVYERERLCHFLPLAKNLPEFDFFCIATLDNRYPQTLYSSIKRNGVSGPRKRLWNWKVSNIALMWLDLQRKLQNLLIELLCYIVGHVFSIIEQ